VSRDDRPDVSQLIATTLRILTEPIGIEPLPTPDRSDAGAVGTPSPPMPLLWDLAARVAPTDSTVLITGESGVGKERLARWQHGASPRAQGPFVAVNCGALADALLESELFGHVARRLHGAVHDRLGMFEAAQSGTLFLDEIGEVSPPMQVKLLRAIQGREVMRLGETKGRPFDVRLVAATNRDLDLHGESPLAGTWPHVVTGLQCSHEIPNCCVTSRRRTLRLRYGYSIFIWIVTIHMHLSVRQRACY
jgi:DNA-binding NtrC family response regulator